MGYGLWVIELIKLMLRQAQPARPTVGQARVGVLG